MSSLLERVNGYGVRGVQWVIFMTDKSVAKSYLGERGEDGGFEMRYLLGG